MSYYIHSVPGRLRVQASRLRHASCNVQQLCTAFKELSGIQNHKFNRKAGSILVQYDETEVTAQDIMYQMHKAGCLDAQFMMTSNTHSAANRVGSLLGNALFGTLVKKGLETSVTSLAKALI